VSNGRSQHTYTDSAIRKNDHTGDEDSAFTGWEDGLWRHGGSLQIQAPGVANSYFEFKPQFKRRSLLRYEDFRGDENIRALAKRALNLDINSYRRA
jgi:hypothetical protein